MFLDGIVVDAGDHQGHVIVHPPVAGVVDDDSPGLDQLRRPLGAHLAARGAEHQVGALDRLVGSADGTRSRIPRRGFSCPPSAPRRRGRTSDSGNLRCARTARIVEPTAPVAPTTPTRYPPSPLTSVGPLRVVLLAGRIFLADRVLAELEGGVQRLDRLGDLVGADHAGDLDRGGGDHLDVDPVLAEDAEDLRGNARMASHSGPDDRDLAHRLVGLDPDARVLDPGSPRRRPSGPPPRP